MTRSNKFWGIVFLCVTLTALILLSAGLSELNFNYGEPFSIRREAKTDGGGLELPTFGEGYIRIILAIFAGLQLLLPLAIIYFFISREARTRVIRTLLSLMWIVAIYFLISSGIYPFTQPETGLPETLPPGEVLARDIEFTYSPPQWLVTIMTLALAISIATLLAGIFIYIRRRIRRKPPPLEQLAHKAQEAIDALTAGADLKNSIIRCYYEMSRILLLQRGLKRDKAMTPREFERDLENAGLPGEQVRSLTRLFEVVRYGTKVPDEEDERLAIESLTSIVEAIRSSP